MKLLSWGQLYSSSIAELRANYNLNWIQKLYNLINLIIICLEGSIRRNCAFFYVAPLKYLCDSISKQQSQCTHSCQVRTLLLFLYIWLNNNQKVRKSCNGRIPFTVTVLIKSRCTDDMLFTSQHLHGSVERAHSKRTYHNFKDTCFDNSKSCKVIVLVVLACQSVHRWARVRLSENREMSISESEKMC